ncbi:MAG: hypothetical protein F6K26_20780 [Moorea sp. SIO2I5]|nr:hypothetical protein [Moorena sp. SIO2I5]
MTRWLELGSWWNRHLACDQYLSHSIEAYSTQLLPIPDSRFPMSQARCLCHTTACATELLGDPKKLETSHQASAVSEPAHSPSHQQGCRTERKPLVAWVVTI